MSFKRRTPISPCPRRSPLTTLRVFEKMENKNNHFIPICAELKYFCVCLLLIFMFLRKLLDRGSGTLLERIRSNDPSLTVLDLSRKKLDHRMMVEMAESLSKNTHISKIDLEENEVGETSMVHLVRGIRNLPSLRILILNRCSIGDRGCIALSSFIHGNACLQELYLQENGIMENGAGSLAVELHRNHSLQILNLTKNQIGDMGARDMAYMLSINIELKELYLNSNEIHDDGAISLANALSESKSLRKLWLDANKISDRGAMHLAKGLEKNFTIVELFVGRNPIASEDWRTLLQKYMERNASSSPPTSEHFHVHHHHHYEHEHTHEDVDKEKPRIPFTPLGSDDPSTHWSLSAIVSQFEKLTSENQETKLQLGWKNSHISELTARVNCLEAELSLLEDKQPQEVEVVKLNSISGQFIRIESLRPNHFCFPSELYFPCRMNETSNAMLRCIRVDEKDRISNWIAASSHPRVHRILGIVDEYRAIHDFPLELDIPSDTIYSFLVVDGIENTSGSLLEYLHLKHSILPIEELVDICVKVCSVVCFLHANGIVHGRLQAQTVFLKRSVVHDRDRHEDVVVNDVVVSEVGMWTPNSSDLQLNLNWLSLETLEKGCRHRTFMSDIWSMGLLFRTLCTGKLPFATCTDVEALKALIMDGSWEDAIPARITDSLGGLVDVIDDCLCQIPSNRPSADDVMTRLRLLES
eukprot:TRINITY_DN4337_c0_g1_i2.p1 TRINITY_DN4337_c0_g1~~TRINITY_DN4337_c0_g1_i2.p1  ORF type:complete len:699 (+),score=159.02 TRINITY_DN4337_c0_g1_i2:65-2161(+)